ncbi:coiled-coil domain-containing protein 85C [Athalia rosae]|uniref:coiled-coil domain-containing protein 85C n=1 Tax=Athalia rosae TaxID=37344 RepID=UPI0020342330|nr:coiled-coil domain-containing protein 85C [Athalia rosae]
MSNKNKTQHQHQQQHQQQQQQQQQQNQQQHTAHMIKPVQDTVPPRYQPPPQPTTGILKHHPHFPPASSSQQQQQHQQQQQQSNNNVVNTVGSVATVATIASSGGAGSTGNGLHPQQQQHHHHVNHQQLQRVAQTQLKDVQSKFPGKIIAAQTDHSNPSNPTTVKNSAAHGYIQGKIPQGQIIPPASQYPPTQIVARQRISDEDFLRLGPVEMLKFVRKTETDISRVATEQNRQIQGLLNELRALKEANQRLSDDNQELRDLCCFLDDDRQKGRKLAREWQRFGRYTASVMRQEVSAYQNKLRQLDNKQQELIKDNLELKELCLYLDEERGGGQRDDGDGSSSSTNAEETVPPRSRHTSTFNDQTMQYVRSLEQRVKQLEEDKSVLQARAQGWEPPPGEVWENPNCSPADATPLGGRPEAVVRALQVLEVREQLEREGGHDGEKALVREMCNVVWRKLEEAPQPRH